MVTTIELSVASLREAIPTLRAGDRVGLSGTVYTSRDAAHARLFALLDAGEPLPYPLRDACIYYCGATPAPEGLPIGACGPTTSGRMDVYASRLYGLGLAATIGKGARAPAVVDAIRQNGGVYFCATGGAGALAARCVTSCETVAFHDLGCEAVKRLELCGLPLVVGVDACGGTIFSVADARLP